MKTLKKYYVLVANSNIAFKLYEELKRNSIKCTMAPTPREAEHCCGIAILYDNPGDAKIIKEIALNASIVIEQFYNMDNKDDPYRNKFC